MTALFDTSVLVGIEQRRVRSTVLPEQAAVCVMTLEELRLGVLRASPVSLPRRRETYRAAARLVVLPVDATVAESCAEIRAEGRARGRRYQLADSLIGATARVHGLPLLTQDEGMLGMFGVDVRVV